MAVCTDTSVAPYALPTLFTLHLHLSSSQTMLLSSSPFKMQSSEEGKKEKEREPDDCNFARGRESSWSLTSRNVEEREEGKGESFKFNVVRFISGCGLLGGRNDLIRACARRQAAPPSRGNSISLRR